MAHYAFLDENNIVTEVIVGIDESELIEGLDPEIWYGNFKGKTCKRTSYNTSGGVHIYGGTPYRKNYAGIGYSYDEVRDAFIPPKPYDSWIINEDTCFWESPTPYPSNENIPNEFKEYNNYNWDDQTINWVLQKPFPSWILNPNGYYESPTPYPIESGQYYWSEDSLNWVLFPN